MILEVDHWYLGYSQILTDCRADEGSVLILANADVDAVAAARVWSYMLRADGIPYQLLPCRSISQMEKLVQTTETVRAIVLLNMGASRNLTRLFEKQLVDPSVKVYVTDCRRPVHLANVHAGDNVVVFWDSVQTEEVPSDGDNLSGNDESSSSEEEDEDDDDDSSQEEEFQDDNEGEHEFDLNPQDDDSPPLPATDTDDQEPDYDGEDEREPELQSKKKQKIVQRQDKENKQPEENEEPEPAAHGTEKDAEKPPSLTPRELHKDRLSRLQTYYTGGSFYGTPAAYVAYRVSTQLRFGEVSDLLWLACVGVTDAYLLARLDVAGYTSFAMDLRTYCTRLFPNSMSHRVETAVFAEHLTGGGNNSSNNNEAADNDTNQGGRTKIGFSENGRILCETDFRFFLLRHTSLYDAMVYSDFLSTRFQLSTSRGMHKLQELLAKMGFPLDECRQPFAFMKPALRRRLQEEIREHAEDYGLQNFEFTSFFRVCGYQSLLSASDTSYAVTALLEYSPTATDDEDEELLNSFNNAYDALNSNTSPTVGLHGLSSLVNGSDLSGSTGLGYGIRLAMTLQKSIMATAVGLIDRHAITKLPSFRYAYLSSTSADSNKGGSDSADRDEPNIFSKPLALTRLAHYLMDLNRENGSWTGANARPLILLAEKPKTKTHLVVGYEYPEQHGHFVKNRFGKNFELAAQSIEGTFKFDSFDSHVLEANSENVGRFIEQLHYLMESL
jgi:cell division control protein 45